MEKGVRLGRSDTPEEIQKHLSLAPGLFLVADDDGKIVGTVLGGFDGRRGLIYHLAVAASHRRRGIGSRLMDEVEARMRTRGCIRSYLLVTTDNEETMRFYEKCGWERMDHIVPFAKNLD